MSDDARREGDAALLAERDRLRNALRYLADPESWQGDPHDAEAILYGPDTPFELARHALGEHDE